MPFNLTGTVISPSWVSYCSRGSAVSVHRGQLFEQNPMSFMRLAAVCAALSAGGCMRLGYELLDGDTDGAVSGGGGSGGSGTSVSPIDDAGFAPALRDADRSPADGEDATPGGAGSAEGGLDAATPASSDAAAAPAFCQSFGGFSAPQVLSFASSGENWGPGPSADNTTLFVGRTSSGDENVAVATRPDRGTAFGTLSAVPNVNSTARDGTPFITADGLSLYFFSERAGGLGQRDLMLATRPDPAAAFSAPSFLTALNSSAVDHEPRLSADQRSLVFESSRAGGDGGPDIWLAERASVTDTFIAPRNVSELNTSVSETGPTLSADALTLIFASNRAGSAGGTDIYLATRPDRVSPFGSAQNQSVLNSSQFEYDPALSLDGEEIFFVSTRSGTPRLWRAQRACLD